MEYSASIEKLIEEFEKLPSIRTQNGCEACVSYVKFFYGRMQWVC